MRSLIVTWEPYHRLSWCWSCARSLLHGSHIEFAVWARWLRRHSLSLAEALTLCISIVFSTQTHIIVCMISNHHQVAFFRCIRCCKQGLLVTLHLGAYCGLHCQKTGSIRATRCWLWFCTRCDNPFLASCCFRNVGVHVVFDVSRPPPIHFSTKDTQGKLPESVMSWSPCRVSLQWRCSSEDRYPPILLQVWKSLHKAYRTLLHPPSLVPCYPS